MPAESVKALARRGFFRLLQPASHGGLEADPIAFFTAVRLIASACGSTGWVASVLGVHPWQLALFPPQAQEEVWGADPAARMSSSYAPTGRARAAEDGYRLDGRWSFTPAATTRWVLLGAIVVDGDGKPIDFRTFLLPAATTASTTCGTRSGCAAPAATTSWWTARWFPRTWSLSFTDVTRCACPGQERNPGPLVPDSVRIGLLQRHHDADHRHGDRGLRRARGLPA